MVRERTGSPCARTRRRAAGGTAGRAVRCHDLTPMFLSLAPPALRRAALALVVALGASAVDGASAASAG
ncbi:hypothetical protein T261_8028 [Streptomyces lydicus]|nr:hypothetical protein T261_8028 [Streptomyces lydicus]